MTSKTLNKIMIVAAILFCVIFGVSIYIKNERLRRLDEAYDKQMEEQRKNENQNAFDDASQTQKNNQANNGSNTSSEKDVDFTDFVSVYSYEKVSLLSYLLASCNPYAHIDDNIEQNDEHFDFIDPIYDIDYMLDNMLN